MADGPYESFARRSDDCRMAGHYWSDHYYSFARREFVQLPAGVQHCGWCKTFDPPSYGREHSVLRRLVRRLLGGRPHA
jgi:hypothetical protein